MKKSVESRACRCLWLVRLTSGPDFCQICISADDGWMLRALIFRADVYGWSPDDAYSAWDSLCLWWPYDNVNKVVNRVHTPVQCVWFNYGDLPNTLSVKAARIPDRIVPGLGAVPGAKGTVMPWLVRKALCTMWWRVRPCGGRWLVQNALWCDNGWLVRIALRPCTVRWLVRNFIRCDRTCGALAGAKGPAVR